jgi:hypothetical protein
VVFFMSPASAPSYGGLIKLSDWQEASKTVIWAQLIFVFSYLQWANKHIALLLLTPAFPPLLLLSLTIFKKDFVIYQHFASDSHIPLVCALNWIAADSCKPLPLSQEGIWRGSMIFQLIKRINDISIDKEDQWYDAACAYNAKFKCWSEIPSFDKLYIENKI